MGKIKGLILLLALVTAAFSTQANGGLFKKLDKAFHDATGLPTPSNPKPSLPNPVEAIKSHTELAASIAATTGCEKCATEIANAGDAVQKSILDAVNDYGFIIAPPGDLGGQLMLMMLTADGEEVAVDVPTTAPPPPVVATPKWDIVADCLVQRTAGRIDAYSKTEFANLANIADGDILNASAPKECPEYNIGDSKSITATTMQMAGASINPRAKEGALKYVIVGKVQ